MKLNEDTLFILGRANFWCHSIARIMRQLGHEIPDRAEHEQAHVINIMLEYYEKFGSDWRIELDNYLRSADAREVESAALAKAVEQDPVCEVVQLNQDRYLSLTCVGAVKPKVGDKLYAQPLPAQAIPEAQKVIEVQVSPDGHAYLVSPWHTGLAQGVHYLSASPKP